MATLKSKQKRPMISYLLYLPTEKTDSNVFGTNKLRDDIEMSFFNREKIIWESRAGISALVKHNNKYHVLKLASVKSSDYLDEMLNETKIYTYLQYVFTSKNMFRKYFVIDLC